MAVAVTSRWIAQQRDRYHAHATSLDPIQREQLRGVFEDTTLDTVRILRVPLLENPDFYPDFAADVGQRWKLLDFRAMGGVTYGDTILISTAKCPGVTPIRLVFHELVHVVQYGLLGVDGFADAYVRGWVDNNFDYRSIPLERQAYAMEAEFAAGQLLGGPVELRVRGA